LRAFDIEVALEARRLRLAAPFCSPTARRRSLIENSNFLIGRALKV
jgi:hypothetical protein